jgi:uncharacterized protein YneR
MIKDKYRSGETMGMHRISQRVLIHAPLEKVSKLVADAEKRMRLHPSWEVLMYQELDVREGEKERYRVKVKKESGEVKEYTFAVTASSKDRIAYRAEGDDLEVELLLEDTPRGVKLTQVERFSLPWEPSERTLKSMEDELRFWLEGIKHYCELQGNPIAQTSKFLIDRLLLKLPPSQRRIVLLIIILNAGILLLFIVMFAGMKVASMVM